MPTKHPRIQITADPELAAALRRARVRHPGVPASRLIRDLALRGEAAEDEQELRSAEKRAAVEAKRRDDIEWLIEYTTKPGGLDREALAEAHGSWTHNVDP
jgi:hypothetical protein